MSRTVPSGVGAARGIALAACLILAAVSCTQEPPTPAPAPEVAKRPAWKPPAPPPAPKSCGIGCLEGKGSTVVRFQMAGGDHSASVSVEGNEGVFTVGPPINISENAANWSGITTFFNSKPGVYPLRIRATGKWTLTVVKGKQSYVDE